MTLRVARHAYPTENASEGQEVLRETVNWVLGELEDPDDLGRSEALGATLSLARSCCSTDVNATKFATWEAWVTAMQVGSALFDSATADRGPATCRIGVNGEVKHLPATGPRPYLHPGAWVTSWYLATICRDNSRLDRLARVPVSFLRASGAVFDDFIYDWVEALQAFWHGQADVMWPRLVAAIDGTEPNADPIARQDRLLKVLYPPLELFQLYQRQEADRFNDALSRSLTWHKEYWTADSNRSMSNEGLVALGPLALACMARDANFPINVQSAYLPRRAT